MRGGLEVWDVIPVPPNKGGMRIDVITPHHRDYYEGKAAPGTWEDPQPHTFLTLPPGTELNFVLRWNPPRGAQPLLASAWKRLVQAALDHAGDALGFGAKTAVGYGRFGGSVGSAPTLVFSPPPPIARPTAAQLAEMSLEDRVGTFDLTSQGLGGLEVLLREILAVPDQPRRRGLVEGLRQRARGAAARVVFVRLELQ